jgi:hypothetical protein
MKATERSFEAFVDRAGADKAKYEQHIARFRNANFGSIPVTN